jgi:Protein of unknown function (DUF4435)
MTFTDELKAAGTSKTAVLHEFLTQHDPGKERVHAFVEGFDDPFFYREKLKQYAGDRKVYFYTCDGKAALYQVYEDISKRIGTYCHTLYFTDKDLEDIIPEIYPKDERIYVTDYYSIENHIVSCQAIERSCTEFVRVKHCGLPLDMVSKRFESELAKFHELNILLMAWIVCVRRSGRRPNLNNIDLKNIFSIDDSLRVSRKREVVPYLCKASSIPNNPASWKGFRKVARDLRKLNPKVFVRGKFETWFLTEFLKNAIAHLRKAARDQGGSLDILVSIERNNTLALLAPRLPSPPSLDAFLRKHFGLFKGQSDI